MTDQNDKPWLLGALLLNEAAGGWKFRGHEFNPHARHLPLFSCASMESFARKRGIAVDFPGWEMAVIFQAAAEHREISGVAKGRGRPKADPYANGLLDVRSPKQKEEDRVYTAIERLKDALRSIGRKATQAEAARLYVQHVDGVSPDDPSQAERFASKVKSRETLASAARTRQSRQAKRKL